MSDIDEEEPTDYTLGFTRVLHSVQNTDDRIIISIQTSHPIDERLKLASKCLNACAEAIEKVLNNASQD